MSTFSFLFALAFIVHLNSCIAQQGQPMRFETPKMNEEEEHSMHIPGSFEMKCDACTAVAYQVTLSIIFVIHVFLFKATVGLNLRRVVYNFFYQIIL